MKNNIDISNIQILTLKDQLATLKEIDAMFDNDIINPDSFDEDDFDDGESAERHCDKAFCRIQESIMFIDKMIKAIEESMNAPDQINEANWDRD